MLSSACLPGHGSPSPIGGQAFKSWANPEIMGCTMAGALIAGRVMNGIKSGAHARVTLACNWFHTGFAADIVQKKSVGPFSGD